MTYANIFDIFFLKTLSKNVQKSDKNKATFYKTPFVYNSLMFILFDIFLMRYKHTCYST